MARRYFSVADGAALIALRRKALAALVAAIHRGDDLTALEERYNERHATIAGVPPEASAWATLERRARLVARMDRLRERGVA